MGVINKGDLVEVEFWDHSYEYRGTKKTPEDQEPMRHVVWGKVVSITKKLLTVCHWEHLNGEDKEHCEMNSEYSRILIRDVIHIKPLVHRN